MGDNHHRNPGHDVDLAILDLAFDHGSVVATEPRWLDKLLGQARKWDTQPMGWPTQTACLMLVAGWSWALMALGPEGVPNFIYNGF